MVLTVMRLASCADPLILADPMPLVELLTPDFQDSNSLFITQKLNEAGFQVHYKTIVGDLEDDLAAVFRAALQRSDLVILSGGLGPTEDDLTRQAVARVLERPLVPDPAILNNLRQKFADRGYSMPKINERQAEVIQGAEILDNLMGTAPGLWIEKDGVRIALLPGPPREIKPMFERLVMPRLIELGGGRRLVRKSFSIGEMTESEVDALVAPVYKTFTKVHTTILTGAGQIALHLSQWIEKGERPEDLAELAARIQSLLGDAVFTTENESLEQVVARLLTESGVSLSVAESCTSGMIGSRVTRIPGSSNYFLGGVLCYSNEAKTRLCGVPGELLERCGAVSAEVAEALAQGVRELFQSSIGLSATGIAGPGGGSAEKPVGLVYIGLSDGARTRHYRRVLPGNRDAVRERATLFALSCLRNFLLSDSRTL